MKLKIGILGLLIVAIMMGCVDDPNVNEDPLDVTTTDSSATNWGSEVMMNVEITNNGNTTETVTVLTTLYATDSGEWKKLGTFETKDISLEPGETKNIIGSTTDDFFYMHFSYKLENKISRS